MAVLWEDEGDFGKAAQGSWVPMPIGKTGSFRLADGAEEAGSGGDADSGDDDGVRQPMPPGGAVIVPYLDDLTRSARWVLLASVATRVRVNGALVTTGLRALRDHDAIQLPSGAPRFFSTERLPAVEPFPNTTPAPCRRCGQRIEHEAPAVQCPICAAWHHQGQERGCWSALPKCSACDRPTSSEEYVWSPAQL